MAYAPRRMLSGVTSIAHVRLPSARIGHLVSKNSERFKMLDMFPQYQNAVIECCLNDVINAVHFPK